LVFSASFLVIKYLTVLMDDLLKWAQDKENCCTSRDWPAVLEKLKKLKLDKVHIVADFDMTLTQYLNPKTGQRSLSSHGALGRWAELPKEMFERLNLLYKTYYPMEISTELTYEEKVFIT
jgi:Pyrimidine 5'-nucleotidase (UMPH-1)